VVDEMSASLPYDDVMVSTAREPLTRDRVIGAAVAFADEHGVDDLSMRKLGAELGVEAMSLYNHVENKDDMFDGMIDFVFSAIPIPDEDLDWKEHIRRLGQGTMTNFGRHPWILHLCMARGLFGLGALRFMDHVLGVLAEAGFDDDDAHHAWQMMASHTMGYAFQASAGITKDYAEFELMIPRLTREVPNVARMAPFIVGCSWDEEYMFGLDIILDGLQARLS
jgi:AcrR family transcriptional regulator